MQLHHTLNLFPSLVLFALQYIVLYHIHLFLQIYDGSNVSAPGSLWTYNAALPMFSSTGPHIYIVYKTGQLVMQDNDIGCCDNVDTELK